MMMFLKSLIYCDKDIEQSITYQNKITDVNERYINKIQIADYLKLKGDNTNACVEHLDVISKIDFENDLENVDNEGFYDSPYLNGKAIDTTPRNVSFDLIDGDQPSGVVSCDYIIIYQTSTTDLST